MSGWVWDLAVGFYEKYHTGQAFQDLVADILVTTGVMTGSKFLIQNYIENHYSDDPGVTDMAPGSSFLSQLNSQPENTIPSARYAIYGEEYFQTHWHLMGSVMSGPGSVEDPAAIQTHYALMSFYAYLTTTSYANAFSYQRRMWRAQENYNFEDVFYYKQLFERWLRIATAFQVGFDSLYYGQQYQWSRFITGSLQPPYNVGV